MFKNKIVFIVGMHRSGSSLLSSYIASLGYDLGNSENKTKDEVNPLGYFENDKLTTFHDEMLNYNQFSWDTATGSNLSYTPHQVELYCNIIQNDFSGEKIVVKDPRLSFFESFLLEVSQKINYKPYFLFATRNKKETVSSLMKAQNKSKQVCSVLYDNTQKCFNDSMLSVSYNDHILNEELVQKKICDYIQEKYKENNLVNKLLYRNKE